MNFDHEQRFERIVAEYLERPAGDYAELLHRGYVTSPPGVDPEASGEPERRAKTRSASPRFGTATARSPRASASSQPTRRAEELRYEFERHELVRSLKHAAEELGHEIRAWVRNDQENITSCSRCGARIYALLESPPVTDGEAVSEPCPAA